MDAVDAKYEVCKDCGLETLVVDGQRVSTTQHEHKTPAGQLPFTFERKYEHRMQCLDCTAHMSSKDDAGTVRTIAATHTTEATHRTIITHTRTDTLIPKKKQEA